jgi:monoamine oxidase
VPLAGAAVHTGGRSIANLDDLERALGPEARQSLVAFDTWARTAMTPREFYAAGSDEAAAAVPEARCADVLAGCEAAGFVETLIHSDLATEPAATTAAYGLQNYLMNDPAYLRLYRIAGGNEQLVSAVASRLAATVWLDSPVTRVAAEPGGPVRLTSCRSGREREDEFDLVILALPVGPLAGIEFADDALAAAIRRHLAHHDHPAHYLRITFLLERPVGAVPGDDDFVMLDAFSGTCLYIESGRDPTGHHGVVGLLIGGQAAADMACLSDDELAAAGLAALPEPFAAWRDHVIEARVHRWIGAVSGVPGGWQPLPVDRRHRPSPAHPQVMVVGDYLYDSTLNGVLDSADHVAGWVAATLADSAAEVTRATGTKP